MSTFFYAIDPHGHAESIEVEAYAEQILLIDTYAYIADYDESLISIIDISNKSPVSIGSYKYKSEDCQAMQVVGNYAYMAGGEDGIEIFNISDISNPTFVKQVKIPAFSLDTYKNYLYAKNCMRAYSPAYISVLEIKKDGKLSLIHEVPIPECSDFKIKDGITCIVIFI